MSDDDSPRLLITPHFWITAAVSAVIWAGFLWMVL
jgi:hypothetical protein